MHICVHLVSCEKKQLFQPQRMFWSTPAKKKFNLDKIQMQFTAVTVCFSKIIQKARFSMVFLYSFPTQQYAWIRVRNLWIYSFSLSFLYVSNSNTDQNGRKCKRLSASQDDRVLTNSTISLAFLFWDEIWQHRFWNFDRIRPLSQFRSEP